MTKGKLKTYASICLMFMGLLNIVIVKAQSDKVYFHELFVHGTSFNKKINVLFEDTQGFLWIGTNVGLFKYDGNNITHYQHDIFDESSIPNNSVNSIIEDANQNLWIGCNSYLVLFDRKKNGFEGFYKNSKNVVLSKSTKDEIWVRRRRNELVKINPHIIADSIKFDTHFNYNNNYEFSDTRGQVNVLEHDNFNRIWIGTENGLWALNNEMNYLPTNFNENVQQLIVIENNKFLVLTERGLFVLAYNERNFQLDILESYVDFIKNPLTLATTLSKSPSKNEYWIGTNYGLIKAVRHNNKFSFTQFFTKDRKGDLLSNNITSITFDKYSNLWVGTPKGVNKLIDRTSIFEFIDIDNSVNEFFGFWVNSILFESPQTLLIGTSNNGIFQYKTKSNSISKVQTEIHEIGDIKLNFEKDKLLIAGFNVLYKSSLTEFINNRLKTSKIKSYSDRITAIEVVNKNEIWLGVWNHGIDIINKVDSLSKFKQKVVRKFKYNHTSDLHLAKNNNLWIGTRGEGLFRVDLKNERIYEYLPSKESGLSSEAILSIHEDEKNNIWIGTRGGGLNLYEAEKDSFKTFGLDNDLISKTIKAIEHDYQGNLWLSTTKGIVRFNVPSQKFDAFGVEDGIIESQFKFNSSAVSVDHKKLFFGSQDGFYTINSANYSPVEIIPSTVITNFSTLGAVKIGADSSKMSTTNQLDIHSGLPVKLPFDQNNVTFEFSSLDLTAPTKNEYAYTLEGVNNYWIYTTAANRIVTYNDLNPGAYVFKVKSSNSNGVWNELPAEFAFNINPPYWRSSMAYITYLILILTLLYVTIVVVRKWYRLKQNLIMESVSREKDKENSRMMMIFFTDISHELRTPLTLIFGTIEKILKNKNFSLEPIAAQRIYNNSLRMKRLINQIMDIRKYDVGKFKVKVENNDIVNDLMIYKKAFDDLATTYQIDYTFSASISSYTAWYDSEILEKILFNLLSNAFKYTPENGKVYVHAEIINLKEISYKEKSLVKGNYLKCTIHDNGLGIPEDELALIFDRFYQSTKLPTHQVPGTGIGMELVQKLIDSHHGKITIDSEVNNFTEFVFYLPVEKAHYRKEEFKNENNSKITRKSVKSETEILYSDADTVEVVGGISKSKILIVEDNPELRIMIREELKNEYEVIEASNGMVGYDQILKENPELIISDIRMPMEDGISMLKRIKGNIEIKHIPVFMLTAKNTEEVKIKCLSLGADDFIEKPFSFDFLKWKVKNSLSTQRNLKEKFSKVISPQPSNIKIVSKDERFIQRLIGIIENSIDDNLLSVEFLASEAGMSRANLYRKLQVIVNDTPVNFIKKIRLKRAAQLLKENKLYISEVAYMTGFNNQKYFGKCFRKEYGVSPTDYVKNHIEI